MIKKVSNTAPQDGANQDVCIENNHLNASRFSRASAAV
jgi:hypothetical protein